MAVSPNQGSQKPKNPPAPKLAKTVSTKTQAQPPKTMKPKK